MKKKMAKSTVIPRKNPTQRRSHTTVDSILKAAAHILDREGFEKLDTNAIAERAGVSVGSLYQYFPNKQSIIAELINRHYKVFIEQLQWELSLLKNLPLREALRRTVLAMAKLKLKDHQLERIISREVSKLDQMKRVRELDRSFASSLSKFLVPYQSQLRPANLETACQIIVYAFKGIPISRLKDPQVIEELCHLAFGYFEPHAEPTRVR